MEGSTTEMEDDTTKPKTALFQVSAALFEELGERLVSKPEIALAELIKNAYDADADCCTLVLSELEIVVEDTGHGMTEAEFLNNWMVISSQAKGLQRFSRTYRRSMAGSKGVGRFSARYLGNAVELISIARDEDKTTCLTATFDWQAITKFREISSVQVNYTCETVEDDIPTGTTLRIYNLRREAKHISSAKVKSDILKLTDPTAGLEAPPFEWNDSDESDTQQDPGFSVKFLGDLDRARDSQNIEPLVQSEILDAYVGRVRLNVDSEGILHYQVFWRGHAGPIEDRTFNLTDFCNAYTPENLKPVDDESVDDRGLIKEVESIQHLPVATSMHSPMFVDLRFFPKRKGTFDKISINGTQAHSWIREHASIALVDNHFAMAAYSAEDSDWLGIDASKAVNKRDWQSIFTPALYPMDPQDKSDTKRNPMLALPSTPQLIGRVHIATSKRPQEAADDSEDWLQPNMDRESLRSNGAFRILWHIARFSVELLAHFDRKLRLDEAAAAQQKKEKEVRTALSKAILDLGTSTKIDPEYRSAIVEQLQNVQSQLTETSQYERESRVSLELMAMMGVLGGFMTHEFEKAVRTLRDVALDVGRMAKKHGELSSFAETLLEKEKSLARYMEYMRVFICKARETKPQHFKANAQVSYVIETMADLARAHRVHIDIDIDPNLSGPYVPLAAYHGIVVNLVSNALKALVPKISSEQRRIRIQATNEVQNHVLVCIDNGIGIPEYFRSRIWDPLFTTTSNIEDENPLGSGLGLGLSVVRRVVTQMHGSIELLEEVPPEYSTAFKVKLPIYQ